MKNKKEKKIRAAVVVAHPDDETIWMGGFILKHPDYDWTILTICRAKDKDRAPKFFRVAKYFSAKGIMNDLDDEGELSIKQTVPIIKKILEKKLAKQKFDFIFTHGSDGEYGHPRHKGAYLAVKEMVKRGEIKTENLYFFNYEKKSKKEFAPPIAKDRSDFTLRLTKTEYAKKKGVMSEIYGFDPDGIDANYCTNPEAFKKFKL